MTYVTGKQQQPQTVAAGTAAAAAGASVAPTTATMQPVKLTTAG